ncbi:D-2-hydroxyacid dehydrogenase [bacterium]|nr:MAG: D-2-hydroxyacid dehydrogenase [bacterium]
MPPQTIDLVISSGDPQTDASLARLISEQAPAYRVAVAASAAECRERFARARVILAWGVPATAFDYAGQLEWLQIIGTGVDAVVPAQERLRGVTVTNVRGVFGAAIAEYVVAYVLAHFQRIPRIVEQQRRHAWEPFAPLRFTGKTVGIAGLGSVGTEIAKRAAALGAHAIGVRRTAAPAASVERVYALDEVAEFFAHCDVLVLALPATAQTQNFMSLERLALLKPDCFVVNVGRGSALPAANLIAALERGLIAGAAIDVFEEEPLPPESPLWNCPGVFITPHVSGINRPEDVAPPILENLRRFAAGEPLCSVVDLERGY